MSATVYWDTNSGMTEDFHIVVVTSKPERIVAQLRRGRMFSSELRHIVIEYVCNVICFLINLTSISEQPCTSAFISMFTINGFLDDSVRLFFINISRDL